MGNICGNCDFICSLYIRVSQELGVGTFLYFHGIFPVFPGLILVFVTRYYTAPEKVWFGGTPPRFFHLTASLVAAIVVFKVEWQPWCWLRKSAWHLGRGRWRGKKCTLESGRGRSV